MMPNTLSTHKKTFRQTIVQSVDKQQTLHVNIGKFILSNTDETHFLRTLLGSCVALIGHKEKIGFMTHLFLDKDAKYMIQELRHDIQHRVGCTLEDFHLTLSGGNRIMKTLGSNHGQKNIDSILGNLQRKPDTTIHLGQNIGNIVQLSMLTGKIESKIISNIPEILPQPLKNLRQIMF